MNRIRLVLSLAGLALLAGCGGPQSGQAASSPAVPPASSSPAPQDSPTLEQHGSQPLDPCALVTKDDIKQITGVDLPEYFGGLDGSTIKVNSDGAPFRVCEHFNGASTQNGLLNQSVNILIEMYQDPEAARDEFNEELARWQETGNISLLSNLGDIAFMLGGDTPFVLFTHGPNLVRIASNLPQAEDNIALLARAATERIG
jgi:Protein of unknown function (DUF3558)